MTARNFLPSLMMLALLLPGCALRPSAAPPTATIRATQPDAKARRAEIKRQLSKVCPVPLTAAELDRLADVVLRYPADADVKAIVQRQDRMDDETAVCRGSAR